VPACEVTSLGAQTQLWNPRERELSSLVQRQDWTDKFPPLRAAWDVLGPLQLELAIKCDLAADIPVLCGISASGANLARYLAAGLRDFALVSTG
jgi:sugar (pentulose or hexulose) kinase